MGTGERVSATVSEDLMKRVGFSGRSKPVSRTGRRLSDCCLWRRRIGERRTLTV